MAIVMLAIFDPEELPGIHYSQLFSRMDVASYNDAWNAVRRVMDNCISKYLAINKTMHENGSGMNFLSDTGWSPIGTMHLRKPFCESVADVNNVLQEAKALLVSSYGVQIRKQTAEYTQSTCQLTAFSRAPDRCS